MGEVLAAKEADRRGYRILNQNVRTPFGEVDLILQKPDTGIVFAEVKTRSSLFYGYPEEAVSSTKLSHMVNSARYLINHYFKNDVPWQIDVIAILYDKRREKITDLSWFENVTAGF